MGFERIEFVFGDVHLREEARIYMFCECYDAEGYHCFAHILCLIEQKDYPSA